MSDLNDDEIGAIVDAAQGKYEFTIAMEFQTSQQFDEFRKALDHAIRIAEANDNTLILKAIAPVGTTERHIDTRLTHGE